MVKFSELFATPYPFGIDSINVKFCDELFSLK